MRKLDLNITCNKCDGIGYKQYTHHRGAGETIPRFATDIEVKITNLSNSGTTYQWTAACTACMTGWPMKVPHCDLGQGERVDIGITHVE